MTIKIQIDFRSGQPIYEQIMEQIQQLVAAGELKQGDQLPTVRQLATDLRVNFNTVARAYRLLDEAGLISTQKGRGTYIWEKPSQQTLDQLRQQGLDDLVRRFLAGATRLAASPEEVAELVDRHLRLWKEQGQPPDAEAE
jgi:GntR family transcriptional regulator